jgi:hypothetical protein
VNIYVTVRLRLSTLWASFWALKEQSKQAHDDARLEQDPARELKRVQGDYLSDKAEEVRQAIDEGRPDEQTPRGIRNVDGETNPEGE